MQRVIPTRVDVPTRGNFVTTLAVENVMLEDLVVVAPLFETQTAASRVFFVFGATSHHLGGEVHTGNTTEHHVCEGRSCVQLSLQHF